MTISINGTEFTSTSLHGVPTVPPWEFADKTQQFFGVVGEYHLTGKASGRWITIPFELTGLASHYLLQQEVATLASLIGTNGDLIIDLGGGDSTTYTQCRFDGWSPDEPPWKDGSGVNDWQQRGVLKFRQVASA